MQTAEYGLSNDSPLLRSFNGPGKWSVAIKRLMGARGVVELDVFGEDPKKMGVAENDDLVETIPPDRSDHTFGARILPGRTWCGDHFFDFHVFEAIPEDAPVDAIAITDQVLWCFVEWECFDKLLRRPC